MTKGGDFPMDENKQTKDPGSGSEELKKELRRKPNWSTDTIIVNGHPFTIIFPEEE